MPRKGRKRKRRVVIDTSVRGGRFGLQRDLRSRQKPSADVLHNWAKQQIFVWLVSEDVLNEDKKILRRLPVRSHLIGRVVNLIRERAEEVRVRSAVEISPDPEGDPFCLCAEQGKADFLVTLNPKDFPQDRLKAIVVSPDQLPM